MIGFRGVLSFFEGCALARFIAPNAWRTRSRNSAWSTNTRSTPFLKTQAIFSPVQETALLTPAETVPHFCSWKTDRQGVSGAKVQHRLTCWSTNAFAISSNLTRINSRVATTLLGSTAWRSVFQEQKCSTAALVPLENPRKPWLIRVRLLGLRRRGRAPANNALECQHAACAPD